MTPGQGELRNASQIASERLGFSAAATKGRVIRFHIHPRRALGRAPAAETLLTSGRKVTFNGLRRTAVEKEGENRRLPSPEKRKEREGGDWRVIFSGKGAGFARIRKKREKVAVLFPKSRETF